METRFLPCGDTGLTVQFEAEDLRATNARALHLHAALKAALPVGVIETVPAYRALTLHYDPCETSQAALVAAVREALMTLDTGEVSKPRRWHLPICFEGDRAPDLDEVARQTGVSPDEIRRALTETVQSVYMLGFAPGQPYLGDLPEALFVPRRKEPVARVPAGSVLTATAKTVIYPVDNPTGWYVVGRTPVALFSPAADVPVLLGPGDEVVFDAVPAPEFDRLEKDRDRLRDDLIERAGA